MGLLRHLVATLVIAALFLLSGCSDDPDLSGAEILRRSEEKMAKTTVVYEVQAYPRKGSPAQVEVYEYAGTQTQLLFTQSRGVGTCKSASYDPKDGRSDGAEGNGPGGTAPDEIEKLGKTAQAGVEAWQIRYTYDSPSVEGPYPVEVTEWIAVDDYRVLRAEREIYDPFGLIGQLVLVARSFDEETPCPSKPDLDPAKLKPLTTPRLEKPD